MLRIRAMTESDRDWAAAVVARYFGSPEMVSRGLRHDTRLLPGLIAEEGGQRLGLAHYRIEGHGCEVVTLVALRVRQGVGRRMVSELVSLSRAQGCRRIWLVTTNENRGAQRFYEALGWELVAIHHGALAAARRLKPEIPERAADGTPLEDELEYERRLDDAEPVGAPNPHSAGAASTSVS